MYLTIFKNEKLLIDTNHNLTAVKTSIFFRKITIHITTEAASANKNFKGRTRSDFQSPGSQTSERVHRIPSQYDCRSQHCFPLSFGQQILKLTAQVNLTEALLNERKLFPRTNQPIYFSD